MTAKGGRLPPRMHPDDLEAIVEKLSEVAAEAATRLQGELEQRTKYLREEIERLDRRTRSDEILVPLSVHHNLERRVLRLEDELRDVTRSQIKHFLAMDDHENRMMELESCLQEPGP